jgi:hypothetical protein
MSKTFVSIAFCAATAFFPNYMMAAATIEKEGAIILADHNFVVAGTANAPGVDQGQSTPGSFSATLRESEARVMKMKVLSNWFFRVLGDRQLN